MNERPESYNRKILEYLLKLLTSPEAVGLVMKLLVHNALDKKLVNEKQIRLYFEEAMDSYEKKTVNKATPVFQPLISEYERMTAKQLTDKINQNMAEIKLMFQISQQKTF